MRGFRREDSEGLKAWRDELQDLRVLVAEDNEVNQLVIQETLRLVGVEATMAATGQEALDILEAAQPRAFELVLMDMQMPVMDGLQATRRIRQTPGWADLVIIAMTANVSQEDRQLCLSAGMDDFLSKPIAAPRLYATLRRWRLYVRSRVALTSMPVAFPPPRSQDAKRSTRSSFIGDLGKRDPEAARTLTRLFLETTADALTDMKTALACGDFVALGHLAHKIKSSSAAMGHDAFSSGCAALEAAVGSRSPVKCHAAVAFLVELWRKTAPVQP